MTPESGWKKKRILQYKALFDEALATGPRLNPCDIAGLSYFYLLWFHVFNDTKALETAEWLRELTAATLIESARQNHLYAVFNSHIALSIWSENARPSPLWQESHERGIRAFRSFARKVRRRKRTYELVEGVTGLANIAMNIGDDETLEQCLEYLEDAIEKTPFGPSLPAPNFYLKPVFGFASNRQGRVLPGIAHGVSGPVLLLKHLSFHNRFSKRATELASLLSQSMLTMISSESLDRGLPPLYPSAPNVEPLRLAWCAGALGAAFALAAKSKTMTPQLKRARQAGEKIFANCLDPKWKLPSDLHFCHGRSGIAQMIQRSDTVSKKAKQRWLETLDMRPTRTNIFKYPIGDKEFYHYQYSFINGLTGGALTILSSMSKTDVPWDRHFLLSSPLR